MFLGAIIGTFCILKASLKRLVLLTFLVVIVVISGMLLSILAKLFPNFQNPILICSRLIFGLLYMLMPLSQSIVSYHFNRQDDQKWVNIWFGIGILGDPFGMLLSSVLVNNLKLAW